MAEKTFKKKRYTYVVDVVVGAGLIVNPNLTIDDNDFVLQEVSRLETGAFSVRVRGTTDDREWSNNFVNDESFFGSTYGQMSRPYRLKEEVEIPARTVLTFDVRDDSGAPNTIQMVFCGYKKIPL